MGHEGTDVRRTPDKREVDGVGLAADLLELR
jgi:hypothetical protein